eukprot:516950-Karenia_brevis.AAC.1
MPCKCIDRVIPRSRIALKVDHQKRYRAQPSIAQCCPKALHAERELKIASCQSTPFAWSTSKDDADQRIPMTDATTNNLQMQE